MHVGIQRYQMEPGSAEELNEILFKEFMPIIRQIPGFRQYFWVEAPDGTMASVSVYQEPAGVEESTRAAADFIRQRLTGRLRLIDVTEGRVVIQQKV